MSGEEADERRPACLPLRTPLQPVAFAQSPNTGCRPFSQTPDNDCNLSATHRQPCTKSAVGVGGEWGPNGGWGGGVQAAPGMKPALKGMTALSVVSKSMISQFQVLIFLQTHYAGPKTAIFF